MKKREKRKTRRGNDGANGEEKEWNAWRSKEGKVTVGRKVKRKVQERGGARERLRREERERLATPIIEKDERHGSVG